MKLELGKSFAFPHCLAIFLLSPEKSIFIHIKLLIIEDPILTFNTHGLTKYNY